MAAAPRRQRLREHAAHHLGQLGQAMPACAPHTGTTGMPSARSSAGHVDADALAACLVHQVEAEYCTRRQLEHLQHKDQVALQGQVASATRMTACAPARGEKITRGLFLS